MFNLEVNMALDDVLGRRASGGAEGISDGEADDPLESERAEGATRLSGESLRFLTEQGSEFFILPCSIFILWTSGHTV